MIVYCEVMDITFTRMDDDGKDIPGTPRTFYNDPTTVITRPYDGNGSLSSLDYDLRFNIMMHLQDRHTVAEAADRKARAAANETAAYKAMCATEARESESQAAAKRARTSPHE